ncbi:MAG: hypothetical protein ACLTC4_21805, partial [Hungatella hathewayi]
GIAGFVNGTGVTITECGLVGNLSGSGMFFGGCVGAASNTAEMTLDGCYNLGNIDITGGVSVGGIYGTTAEYTVPGHVTIRNSMNRGSVSGDMHIGGIVAYAKKGAVTITGCYNAGVVSVASTGDKGSIVGFYADVNDTDIRDCLIDKNYEYGTNVNCLVVEPEVLGTWGAAWRLNGGSLKQSTGLTWTYVKDSNYPILNVAELAPAESWEPVGEALEYGLLIDMDKPSGDGDTSPYQIQTAEQLAWFAYMVNNSYAEYKEKNARLEADINLFGSTYTTFTGDPVLANIASAVQWKPIGAMEARNGPYRGTFDGGGHEIDGMYINGKQHLGLFGGIQYLAKIQKLGIGANSKVIGSGGDCAMFVGSIRVVSGNRCEVTDCYNLGMLEAVDKWTGVFVGDDTPSGFSGIVSNCYNAGSSNCFGNIDEGMIDNCYADVSVNSGNGFFRGGSGSGVTKMTTEQMKSSDAAMKLNTIGSGESGTLRSGTDRVWYTSLDTEKTKGYPTFEAPTTVAVEFVQDTPEGGSSVTLKDSGANSVTITDMKLRSFGPVDSVFTPGTTGVAGNAFTQTAYTDVTGANSNYHKYGYTNANANLAFKAGETDLKGLSQSLNNPVTSLGNVSSVSLGRAAAYTKPEDRYVLLEGASGTDRYEIQMTVKGSVGKTLSVMMPVRVTMAQLTPDGTDHKDYSVDLNITNKNAYPIDGKILKAESKKESGYAVLTPVKASIALSNTGMLAADTGGVRLGLANLAGKSGPLSGEKYYDKDAAGGTSWMEYRLKYGGVLPYRYFMEYSGIHVAETKQFEYEIGYWFGVSESDYTDTADAVVVR